MVRNTMDLIAQASKNINEKYDMSAHNMYDIHDKSNDAWDMIVNGFKFGYMQGIKATKAETAKYTLKGAEKLNTEQRELVTGIIATLTHKPTPEEIKRRQQEQQLREQEQMDREKHLGEVTAKCAFMTNADYRDALAKTFADVHENYKLRWFYRFITERLRLDAEEKGGTCS